MRNLAARRNTVILENNTAPPSRSILFQGAPFLPDEMSSMSSLLFVSLNVSSVRLLQLRLLHFSPTKPSDIHRLIHPFYRLCCLKPMDAQCAFGLDGQVILLITR